MCKVLLLIYLFSIVTKHWNGDKYWFQPYIFKCIQIQRLKSPPNLFLFKEIRKWKQNIHFHSSFSRSGFIRIYSHYLEGYGTCLLTENTANTIFSAKAIGPVHTCICICKEAEDFLQLGVGSGKLKYWVSKFWEFTQHLKLSSETGFVQISRQSRTCTPGAVQAAENSPQGKENQQSQREAKEEPCIKADGVCLWEVALPHSYQYEIDASTGESAHSPNCSRV